jgi:hypothetical protein
MREIDVEALAANHLFQDPAVQKVVGSSDPVQVMAKLREMNNASWRAIRLLYQGMKDLTLPEVLPGGKIATNGLWMIQ